MPQRISRSLMPELVMPVPGILAVPPPRVINGQNDALKSHFSVTAGSSPMPAELVQVKEEPLSFYHFSARGTQNLDINGIIGAVTRQYP
ncbi:MULTISPECIES: hypothetical protein [Aeromonas]|uniref:hypothetical protein n=1 Tax=Aeromonas TaxID=642 RepID=UPI001B3430D1|nr:MULTISPECIES: hypothetical protein [Aeromonas]MBP4041792.1 hypothetical protein [Aeromonas sp. SrichE-2G]MCO4203587.1 hypothetical protein [Aeromonas taiwanensis]